MLSATTIFSYESSYQAMKSFIESTTDTESKMFWLNRWNTWMDVIKLDILKTYKLKTNISVYQE